MASMGEVQIKEKGNKTPDPFLSPQSSLILTFTNGDLSEHLQLLGARKRYYLHQIITHHDGETESLSP